MSARAVLSFSRGLEFATETELEKRMGCVRHYWLRATIKELIDNGLDAAEEHGVDPEITITLDGRVITVTDNGPGMSPELVERLCIRSERTSTRGKPSPHATAAARATPCRWSWRSASASDARKPASRSPVAAWSTPSRCV